MGWRAEPPALDKQDRDEGMAKERGSGKVGGESREMKEVGKFDRADESEGASEPAGRRARWQE